MDERSRGKNPGQLTFLAPAEAEKQGVRAWILDRIEENLALIRELAALYELPHVSEKRQKIRGPADMAALLGPEMSKLEQEQMRVVILNTRNEVLGIEMVYQGNLNTTVVRLAELFREAIRRNGASVILVHNHPSGAPEASPEDLGMTRLVVKAGDLLDIPVLDHVIIGDAGRYRSIRESCHEVWS